MPCQWSEQDILVLNEIRISPPYTTNSVTGKGPVVNWSEHVADPWHVQVLGIH